MLLHRNSQLELDVLEFLPEKTRKTGEADKLKGRYCSIQHYSDLYYKVRPKKPLSKTSLVATIMLRVSQLLLPTNNHMI